MEYRIRHKDGSYHWVQDNSRVVRDAAGRPQQMVGVWTDITERKRTEQRLREQADIIERAQDAIIMRDFGSDRRHRLEQRRGASLRLEASEAIGRPLGELIYDESSDGGCRSNSCFRPANSMVSVKHRTKDGSEVVVDARVTLIRDDNGTPQAVLGINTDITERKKLEKHLLRTQRLESIGTLASGVAHDLNNVLVPILMVAPMLRGDPSPEEREISERYRIIRAARGRYRQTGPRLCRGARGDRVLLQPIHLHRRNREDRETDFPEDGRGADELRGGPAAGGGGPNATAPGVAQPVSQCTRCHARRGNSVAGCRKFRRRRTIRRR